MLFLGSQSKIKLEAAEAAFPNHNVVGYSVNSGVPEQPVGMNETRLGALNRALGAAKAAVNVKGESSSTSNQEWSVGVENGIWNPLDPYCKNTAKNASSSSSADDGTWVDGACCVAIRSDGEMRVVWSDTINIPELSSRPFNKGQNGEWSELKDPHLLLTNVTRKEYLTKALSKLAKKCYNTNILKCVQWGIIGCGSVCEKKSGPALYNCNGSKLVAVCRRNIKLAKDFAQRHNVPTFYGNSISLINDSNVNAIYIASPPGTHYELAMMALASNKPTYIEKPIARNATETAAIVEAFKNKGVPLFSAYYRRGQERFLKARSLLEEERIGKITSVHYSMIRGTYTMPDSPEDLPWRFRANLSGGGLIMDVGCHTIDAIEFILQCPLTNIKGEAFNLNSTYDVEDTVVIIARASSRKNQGSKGNEGNEKKDGNDGGNEEMDFTLSKNGNINVDAHVTMHWSFCGPSGKREDVIRILGTNGELKMSTFGDDPIILETSNGTKEEFHYDLPEYAQMPLIQTIVDELRGIDDQPCESRGENGLRCATIIDTALTEYYGGNRKDSFWERPETWQNKREK
jgi:1,5-anhydro-D-fructose reductase (1,5-anhydro-D-mannitol-forming)